MKDVMNKIIWSLLFYIGSVTSLLGQSSVRLRIDSVAIQNQLQRASQQIRHLSRATPADKFPQSFENGTHRFSNSSWWCSGFFPGTLLLLADATGDSELLQLGLDKLSYLEKEQFNTGTHDLGFMLYCSFGQALRLTGDSAQYLSVLEQGAASLASRFSPEVGAIRSWDHGSWEYAVIIDNMMNLELLTQVAEMSNQPNWKNLAVVHAEKTMAHHFRDDYSSYHVVDYDQRTGAVKGRYTHQGADDESAWSRGQAWGLYGFTMMFRETEDRRFLEQAVHIADYLLNHAEMPADGIPYWDFDYHNVSGDRPFYSQRKLRDVSAAAVLCSGLIELAQYVDRHAETKYMRFAEKIMKSLSAAPYLTPEGQQGGFILQHSVGALPLGSEIDVPLTYADYYFIEALVRYKKLLTGAALF